MPKRTTEFQKLVYLVKKHSAAGSTVTESKFLADSKGKKREVDICIESNIDGIPLIISIECIESKRLATVEWVERMKGKHDDLPTDVLVLYSRSGFTKRAKEKAQTYRKRIVALETLDETSAERLFGGASSLLFKASSLTPTKVIIGVAASGDLPAEQVNVFTDTAIFSQSGQVIATAETLVNQILRLPKAQIEFLRIGQDHHRTFNFYTPSVTEGPSGNPIYLRKDDHHPPLLRLIESLTVSGDVAVQTSPLPLQHGKLENTKVAWGTIPYQGKPALIVASQDKNADTKASFDTGERSVQLQRPPP
jgi:hypothetical protein